MSKRILLLSLLMALFFVPVTTQAGFIVKRKTDKTEVAATAAKEEMTARQERRQEVLNSVLRLFPQGDGDHECKGCKRHDGWRGTASMWCAIGGFFYFPPALILALVWGSMGMKPGARHRNRAMAGVIISIAGLFFWHLLLVAALWGL